MTQLENFHTVFQEVYGFSYVVNTIWMLLSPQIINEWGNFQFRDRITSQCTPSDEVKKDILN